MEPGIPAPAPLGAPIARAIEARLASLRPRAIEVDHRARAAVLLLLYERDGEPWIVLTKRTETVATHKGQISFPGGARDPEDADLWATAVRETAEELGVDPGTLTRLGALDDHPTYGSGFVVTPFVAAIDPPAEWQPSEHEIAEVIEAPLRTLARIGRAEPWEREGMRFSMHIFDVDEHRVWGVTAFILRAFLDIVGPALGFDEGEPHEAAR